MMMMAESAKRGDYGKFALHLMGQASSSCGYLKVTADDYDVPFASDPCPASWLL